MTVSIIIAVKTWQKNLEECVGKCLGLDYQDFEIIILPDGPIDNALLPVKADVPIKVIPTGPLRPGKKRDKAINDARGEILAIIDDDTYPRSDWLKNALKNFSDSDIAAVGGLAITPPEDSLMQKASGLIYSLPLVSGKFIYRYTPGKRQFVEDFPSCNFLVRKSIMQELGGFKTEFWPGEDTKLCLEITKKLKKKIVYDPQALVYHHRRALFRPHLRQIASYSLHRGYFVKRFPQTSRKIVYFLPSAFVIYLILGAFVALFFAPIKILYIGSIFIYLILVLIFSFMAGLNLFVPVGIGIILTHLTYGIYFIKGQISKKLSEEQ